MRHQRNGIASRRRFPSRAAASRLASLGLPGPPFDWTAVASLSGSERLRMSATWLVQASGAPYQVTAQQPATKPNNREEVSTLPPA